MYGVFVNLRTRIERDTMKPSPRYLAIQFVRDVKTEAKLNAVSYVLFAVLSLFLAFAISQSQTLPPKAVHVEVKMP